MTATTQKRASLTDYAAVNKPRAGVKCWLCDIPERADVEDAYDSGIAISVIAAWLKDPKDGCGYQESNRQRIANHLRQHPRLNGKAAR